MCCKFNNKAVKPVGLHGMQKDIVLNLLKLNRLLLHLHHGAHGLGTLVIDVERL